MTQKVILIGAGGHAAVLAEIVLASADLSLFGFVDNDPDASISEFLSQKGATVIGGDDTLEAHRENAHFHLAIGMRIPEVRQKLMSRIEELDLALVSIVHPTAVTASSISLGDGVAVMANATIQTNAQVGNFCCINTGAIVDHDCRLGRNVFVQPGACLGGSVTVGDNTMIGIGASVRDGINIGRNCVVGGGAFVAEDISDNSIVLGVPARAATK